MLFVPVGFDVQEHARRSKAHMLRFLLPLALHFPSQHRIRPQQPPLLYVPCLRQCGVNVGPVCVCVCARVTQFLLCFLCPSHPLLLFIFSLSLQPVSFNNPQLQPTPWRTSRKARRSSLSAALSATPLRRYVSLHTNLYLSRSRSRSVLLTHTRSPLSLSLSR